LVIYDLTPPSLALRAAFYYDSLSPFEQKKGCLFF
jgi:hypothetical protein